MLTKWTKLRVQKIKGTNSLIHGAIQSSTIMVVDPVELFNMVIVKLAIVISNRCSNEAREVKKSSQKLNSAPQKQYHLLKYFLMWVEFFLYADSENQLWAIRAIAFQTLSKATAYSKGDRSIRSQLPLTATTFHSDYTNSFQSPSVVVHARVTTDEHLFINAFDLNRAEFSADIRIYGFEQSAIPVNFEALRLYHGNWHRAFLYSF